MSVPLAQALRELEDGKWRPGYWLAGDEPFQIDECMRKFRSLFEKSAESYDAEETSLVAWREALESQPLFVDPGVRWVVCRRWEKASPGFQEVVLGFLENPIPDVCVVLVSGKPDKRKQTTKSLTEKLALIEISEPPDRDWARWRPYFEKRVHKAIRDDVWGRILESAGYRLSMVAGDVEKLALFVGEATSITLADVEEFGSVTSGVDVFSFTDCVVTFRRAEAVRQYEWLLRSGEPEIKLAALVLRALRQVKTAREVQGKSVSPGELASQLGVPPFVASKVVAHASHHTDRSIQEAFQSITHCDQALKQGRGNFFADFLVPYFSLTPTLSPKKLTV